MCKNYRTHPFLGETVIPFIRILNIEDLKVLKDVDAERDDFHQIYDQDTKRNESIYNLISAGVLISSSLRCAHSFRTKGIGFFLGDLLHMPPLYHKVHGVQGRHIDH